MGIEGPVRVWKHYILLLLFCWLPLRDSWESCKSRFVGTGRDEAHVGDLADRALRDAGGHWLDSIPGAIGDTPGRRY